MKYEKGMAVKEVYYNKPAAGSFSFTFLDEFSNHFLATASVLVRREVAVNTPVSNNLVSIDMHALLYFLSQGNGILPGRQDGCQTAKYRRHYHEFSL